MSIILLATVAILASLYGILMIALLVGWSKINSHIDKPGLFQPSVSVIIPFRNEYNNLPLLIQNLANQDYPDKKLEFIFINDHSSDKGSELISSLTKDLPGKTIILDNAEGISGKKAALKLGAQSCEGDIILLTDADCQFGSGWISSMTNAFSDEEIKMIQGPVLIHPAKSIVGNLQQIEFLSLMMSAAGSIGINRPILASGANLAVRHQTYLEGSKHLKDKINTGDDMFLLEFLKTQNRKSISYQAKKEAIVTTSAVESLAQFWNQRKRWTSKSTQYNDPEIIVSAIIVLLFNFLFIVTLISGIINPVWLILAGSIWIFKSLVEFPLINSGCKFYKIGNKLKWFLLTQIFYPFYVVFVSLDGVFGNFSWKNRKNKRS